MVRKIYGIRGLLEYSAVFRAGKAKLSVQFSGGTFSGYGTKPATYTTDNPVKQAIIENSPEYKEGRIFLYSQDGDDETEEKEETSSVDKKDETATGQKAEAEKTVVGVSDLQSAKDYLADKCGVQRGTLKTKQSIIDTAKVHGIEFEGI
jgi:hypothetical protein